MKYKCANCKGILDPKKSPVFCSVSCSLAHAPDPMTYERESYLEYGPDLDLDRKYEGESIWKDR